MELHERVDYVITRAALAEYYAKGKGERAEQKKENLDELINAARGFADEYDPAAVADPAAIDTAADPADPDSTDAPQTQTDVLAAFLTHAALEAGEGMSAAGEDGVQLMTLHSAKGLEFPVVFLCGMEEGLFPHALSSDDSAKLEEERRLCYVGITRARQELALSYAETRMGRGETSYQRMSRFISELPPDLVDEIQPFGGISAYPRARDTAAAARRGEETAARPRLRLGQRVNHAKYGDGLVTNMEGGGAHARIEVNFEDAGSKWLVLAYANLQPI